jgi:hypothetical protein
MTTVVIDSRQRDLTVFPDPNKYDVHMQHELSSLKCVRLVKTSFPFSRYTVNSCNADFLLIFNNTTQTISIPHGSYTPVDLATILTSLLPDNPIVTYGPVRDAFTFKLSDQFSFNLEKNTARLFGLEPGLNTSTIDGTLRSTRRIDFTSHVDTIVLRLGNDFEVLKSNNDNIHDAFAMIHKNTRHDNQYTSYKVFDQAIDLKRLKISCSDIYGDPYDFVGLEHYFVLEFSR